MKAGTEVIEIPRSWVSEPQPAALLCAAQCAGERALERPKPGASSRAGRMNDCSEPQAVQWTFCNPGHRYMECEFQLLRGSFLKNCGSDLRSSTFCWVPESESSHSPRQRIVVL